jgi:hypothetical protein
MKTNSYLSLMLACIMLIASSCTGPRGPQGIQGVAGPAGAAGTMIYSGTTAPSSSVGVTGDFYIDLANGMFYGPKTSSGWGTGFSLVGPTGATGAAGANGATVLSGTTVPSSSTGTIGDFYIDLTTAVFYGPKTSTGWGSGFSLQAGALGVNYAPIINTVITPTILDTLEAHGTVVNTGLTPPIVNGVYLVSPNYCFYDNSSPSLAGETIASYEYEFTNQSASTFSININYSDAIVGGDDSGSDINATYLSGSNSSFTIYTQLTGTTNGISYTSLQVLSGQVASGAIDNFQYTFYLESKGSDPDNTIVPVGTIRIFEDQDGVSPAQSTFLASVISKNPVLAQRSLKSLLLNKAQ